MSPDDIRRQFPSARNLSDAEIIQRISQKYQLPVDQVATDLGVQRNEPGFTSSFKSGLASYPTGVGRLMEDMGAETIGRGLRRYGEDVQFRNPSSVTNFGEFMDSPLQGVKEFTGQAFGSTLPAIIPYFGQAGRAATLGGTAARTAAGAAISSAPAYGEIRSTQDSQGIDNKWMAGAGALGTGAIEQLGGIQRILRPQSATRFATDFARSPLRTGVKTGLRTMGEEGLEELAQSPIQQYTGGLDPTNPEQVQDTLFSGFAGAVGSLGFGGYGGARAAAQHSRYNQMYDAAQADEQARAIAAAEQAARLAASQPVNLLQPDIGVDNGQLFNQTINPYDVGGHVSGFGAGRETTIDSPQYGLFGGGGMEQAPGMAPLSPPEPMVVPGQPLQAYPHANAGAMPEGVDVEDPVTRAAHIIRAAASVPKTARNDQFNSDIAWAAETLQANLTAPQYTAFMKEISAQRAAVAQPPATKKAAATTPTAPATQPSAQPYADLYREINPQFQPDKKLKYSPFIKKLSDMKSDEDALAFIREKAVNSPNINEATLRTLEEMHKRMTGKTIAQWDKEPTAQGQTNVVNSPVVREGAAQAEGAGSVQQVQTAPAEGSQRTEVTDTQNEGTEVKRPYAEGEAMQWVLGEMTKRNPEMSMAFQMATGLWDGTARKSKDIAAEFQKQGKNIGDSRVRQRVQEGKAVFEQIVKDNKITPEELRGAAEQSTETEEQVRPTTAADLVETKQGEEAGGEVNTGYTVDSINKVNEDRTVEKSDKTQDAATDAVESGDVEAIAGAVFDAGVQAYRSTTKGAAKWADLHKTERGRKTKQAWLDFMNKIQTSPNKEVADLMMNNKLRKTVMEEYYSEGKSPERSGMRIGVGDLANANEAIFAAFVDLDVSGDLNLLDRVSGIFLQSNEVMRGREAFVRQNPGGQVEIHINADLIPSKDSSWIAHVIRHEFGHVADAPNGEVGYFSASSGFDRAFIALQRLFASGNKFWSGYMSYPFEQKYADRPEAWQRAEAFAQLRALWVHNLRFEGRSIVQRDAPEAAAFMRMVDDEINSEVRTEAGTQSPAGRSSQREQRRVGRTGGVDAVTGRGEHALPTDAWHGTPHNVHEQGGFTTQKIGTGEGAQAYGWGMYFSSAREIAQWYREKLSRTSARLLYKGKDVTDSDKILGFRDILDSLLGPEVGLGQASVDTALAFAVKKAKQRIHDGNKYNQPNVVSHYRSVLRNLESLDSSQLTIEKPGRLYNVELAPDEHEFLDWNAPFRDQSESVREKLQQFASANMFEPFQYSNDKGANIYSAIAERLGDDTHLDARWYNYEAASKALFEVGIPGIKYRGRTSGETNFVVFDDSQVKIKEWESQGGAPEAYLNYPEELRQGPKLVAQYISDTAKNWAKKGLQAVVFGHDLANIAVKEGLTSAKGFFDVLNRKAATRTRLEANVDSILERSAALSDKKAVNAFLKLSTSKRNADGTFGAWGYTPTWRSDVKVDPAAEAAYNRLSEDGKALVDAVFKHGEETYTTVKNLLDKEVKAEYQAQIDRAKNPDQKAKLQREMDRKLRLLSTRMPKLRGPYAPLGRFGEYAAVGKSQAYIDAEKSNDTKRIEELQSDGNHYVVEFYDTFAEAKARSRELSRAYPYADGFERQRVYRDVQEVPWAAISKVKNAIGDMNATEKAKESLNRLVTDIYLTMMVESSARKSEIRRRNVQGAERDMLRSFASQGRAMAHFVAALDHNPEVAKQISDMQNEARDGEYGGRDDRTRVFNEIMARYAQGLDYRPTPFADKAMRVTSFMMLVTSPGYYLQNSLQTGMLTLPMLNARFGTSRSWKELYRAYKDVARHAVFTGHSMDIERLDILPSEKELLRRLRDDGKLDITIAQDLGRWTEKESVTDKGVFGKVMRQIWALPQRLEMINRITSALAAHRLGGNYDYTANLIDLTHGNYAASNAPRFMQGSGLSRLAFQFRKFQLIQVSMIGKLIHTSFAGSSAEEKQVARAALKWVLAHHMVMAGALGLPAANLVGMALAAIGGEDDEPKDAERMLRQAIGDEGLATLLLKGLPAAAGVDLSGKVGMQNAFALLPFVDASPLDRKGYQEVLLGMSGAFIGGLMPRVADGLGMMTKGDYYKGLEMTLPKGLQDAAKAYRFGSEGVTQRNNDVALSPDEISVFDVMTQAVGLPSTTLTERQRRFGDLIEFQTYYRNKASDLRRRYAKAYRENDMEEMDELREEWMGMADGMARNGLKPSPLSSLIKAPQEQSKREKDMVGGVPTNKSTRNFVEAGAAL